MSSDATDTGQYGEDMITGAPWADDPVWLPVEHFSAVGAVRRTAVSMAEDAGLPADLAADVAIVASEIASNLARHARAGVVAVRTVRSGERVGIELLGVDSGPGIPNVVEATMDGHSTAGSLGIGLGAVERKASQFDIYSKVGSGTVLAATLWCPAGRVADPWVAGLVRPIAGQEVCGDAYAAREVGGRRQLLLCDGLGHGLLAAAASLAAKTEFLAAPWDGPGDVLHHVHSHIQHTRGVVAGIAELVPEKETVRFAGVGNVTAAVVHGRGRQLMMSPPGIVGAGKWAAREYEYPMAGSDLVVLHSDGLHSRWDLGEYPGLASHHPVVIAATLLRDAGRRRDDAAVLVARAA